MRYQRLISLPWLLLFCALAAPVISAAQADSPSLVALRTALQGQTLTVKIAGVHAATRVLLHPIDNRIAGGSVQSRAMDILRGSGDFVLSAGAAVRVVKVEEATDAHNDLLRVGVTTPGGGYASLAFLSGKGTLTASSTSQLAALIAPVFDGPALTGLNGNPATVPTGNTAGNAPATPSAVTTPPRPAPAHPANTVVDLPPAAPGYPPLHASQPANEGCWWEPWASEKYKLEFLTQRCGPGAQAFGDKYVFFDDDRGIGAHDASMAEPMHALDVLEKPAAQPIAVAINKQFVAKSKDPASRLHCIARRTPGEMGPTEQWAIVATGAYAKQGRFNKGEDSEDPCPGLGSDDVVGRSYVYVPSDSKTQFLFYSSQDAWPFDLSSVRFLPSGEAGSAAPQETAAAKPSTDAQASTRTLPAKEGVPRPGEWVYVKHSYTHDIARNAATAASFSAVTGAAPKQAMFYLGCNGAAPGGPHVELRAVYPATPGYGPGETGNYGSLLLPGRKRQMTYSLVNASQMTFLTLPLTPADLAVLSFEDETEQNGLAVLFGVGLATATVTADVPPDNAAIEDVIRACHVNLPPRPPKPLAALSPDQVTHLELAKIALGMTEDQVRAALGSQYQFASQTDSRFSNLTFLGAWGTDSTYSATLVDGKVAGFNYAHVFAPGNQPLQTNIVDGITAKAWSPIFNRPPYSTFWVTDAQGIPKLKPRPDRSIHPCANVKVASFTPTRGVLPGAQPARALDRVLPNDNGPDCGVTISLSMQPSPSGNGTVVSLNLSAANDIVFHQFMSLVNAANQQQRKAEHDKLNSVPTPF